MATYELYLWEPDVDLEDDQWQEILGDAEDSFAIAYEVCNEIYYKHEDVSADAPHLLKFFQYLYDVIKQPKYADYFEGMDQRIENDLDIVKRARRIVWHDENILGNETSQEFRRVLYEAIEHSGICAYSSMDGLLCNTDSYTRRNALKDAFQLYPPLKTVKKSNKITSLEHIPKDVKEMREMVFLFMQQHPLGRYFELEEETKYSGSVEKTNGLHFQRVCNNGVKQKFKIVLTYSKKWGEFELTASSFCYDFFSHNFDMNEKLCVIKENINNYLMGIHFNLGFIKFVQDFESKYGAKHDIRYFRFDKEDAKYFNIFLKQLDACLSLFASINSLEKFIDLFLNSDQTVFSTEDDFILPSYNNREISPFGVEQLDLAYMLFTYGNIYPEKIKKIEEYALNYLYPNHFSEVIKEKYKKRFKELFRHINLLNDYLVNPTKDWRELV